MDTTRYASFDLMFRVAFGEKGGEEFQNFFSTIMERRYPADFQRVCPWGKAGDLKNDGYLSSKRMLFQCYAPNVMKSTKCVSKIKTDFQGALSHWSAYFDTWVFVHNSLKGLGPDVVKCLLDLNATHAPMKLASWGYTEIQKEALQLDECELTSLLGAPLSPSSMVDLGMADLQPVIDQIQRLPAAQEPDLRPVPPTKLAHNLLSDSVAVLLKAGMSRAPQVRQFFDAQGVHTRRDEIAQGLRSKYELLHADARAPDDVFHELQKFIGGSLVPDPTRQAAVFALLAFFFEECEIFERPPDADQAPPPAEVAP